jgi:hypothetical protein
MVVEFAGKSWNLCGYINHPKDCNCKAVEQDGHGFGHVGPSEFKE